MVSHYQGGFEDGYTAGVQASVLAIMNHAFYDNKSLAKVESLDLPRRVSNRLRATGIKTVGALTRLSAEQVLGIRNIGSKGVAVINDKLSNLGLSLAAETSFPFTPVT